MHINDNEPVFIQAVTFPHLIHEVYEVLPGAPIYNMIIYAEHPYIHKGDLVPVLIGGCGLTVKGCTSVIDIGLFAFMNE